MNKYYLIRLFCQLFPPIISQKLREKLISSVDIPAKSDFKRNSFTGGVFQGNLKDFHSRRFYIHGYFEWRIIVLAKKILKKIPGVVIEVGANVGTETVSLAKINPNNNVYAFEPLEKNYAYLEKIKKINNFNNLILFKTLVSNNIGQASFNIPAKNHSGSGYILNLPTEASKEIEVTTLDARLKNISSCSLIIMDVEGFEFNVILGGDNIITKFHPYLILEVNPEFLRKRATITLEQLYNHLKMKGYIPFYIGKLKLIEVDLKTFNRKLGSNWICIPENEKENLASLSGSIFFNAVNPLWVLNNFK